MKRSLIIGNGFDLDAGLKTSYKDFMNSPSWPFSQVSKIPGLDTLGSFLRRKKQMNTWFDVEEALYDYAKEGLGRTTIQGYDIGSHDKADFEKLKSSLTSYILDQEVEFIKCDNSVAIAVLSALLMSKDTLQIYSFNYTDLQNIARKFAINEKFVCNQMHGSASGNDIILGIGDKRDINEHYFYFRKIAAPNFASHRIIPDMMESDEVIIFGHSLSSNDHPYFIPFFQHMLDYRSDMKKRRTITIFTRNEEDKIGIKKNLEILTNNQVTLLYSLNQVNIFCTDGSMTSQIEAYLKKIDKNRN